MNNFPEGSFAKGATVCEICVLEGVPFFIWTGCRLIKGHFDVHFLWPHETGSAWIQVPECSLLHVLQGHMVGFSIGYMSSRL